MDKAKLNFMQLRARALAMAIRGHFRAAPEGDAEVLEALASNCLSDLDELLHAPTMVKIVLTEIGPRKIEVIKQVRAFTGLGLKESKELVEAAPVALDGFFSAADSNKMELALAELGATVLLLSQGS
jgi:ribosomal protein L7/L12